MTLKDEIHALAVRLELEEREALSRCRNKYQSDQCRNAYADLYWNHVDLISQRHGMKPMAQRAIR